MPRTDAGIRSRLARHQGRARLPGRLERILAAGGAAVRRADVTRRRPTPRGSSPCWPTAWAGTRPARSRAAWCARASSPPMRASTARGRERLLEVAAARPTTPSPPRCAPTPMLSGMGSTLVAAVFGDEGVEWVSVGDSPLLLFRRGEIALLNEDHSLAPELDRLAAMGRMTHEEAQGRSAPAHAALGGDRRGPRPRRRVAPAARARGRRLRDPRQRRAADARDERDRSASSRPMPTTAPRRSRMRSSARSRPCAIRTRTTRRSSPCGPLPDADTA